MNVEEATRVVAKAALIDGYAVSDAVILRWAELLAPYSFEEIDDALTLKQRTNSFRVHPADLIAIVNQRRSQHAMSNPNNPSLAGLSWSAEARSYVETTSGVVTSISSRQRAVGG